ncbi:hypothetical protein [Kitasatospora herbaricolor]|uniref:Integral membrane protein n=1 Tax=Kitasatospora herbaricolor TaxID=68217 RepID=A0ABZ1W2C3_9ACTN|nr:hypothetical protein [Kitasatospora herbaricolor]
MNDRRKTSLALLVMGAAIAAVGVALSVAFGRGYGAPNFWVATALIAAAWIFERKSGDR